MHRPAALTIVAWLFIVSGILAVIAMAGHLIVARDVNFDLNVLGLWIGPGLLRLEERFRRWALWFVRFGLAALPIALGLFGFFAPARLPLRFFGVIPFGTLPHTMLLVVLALGWVLALWTHMVLQRRDVRMLFLPPTTRADVSASSV